MSNHFATHRPLLMSTHWMITADHPLAAQAGAAVLESGGNAVDAAIAANLVMTTVRPHMCGIGGDLFMLIHMAAKGTLDALNASGRSPAGATLEAYQALGYQSVPETGIHTCTVPGAIAGWQAALEKHGTLGLDTLLAKAIPYAKNGFPVYPELVSAIKERRDILLASGAVGETFLPGGAIPRVGRLMVQPKLAASYQMLMENGPEAFYRGPMGEALVAHSEAMGGFFSETDLARHTVEWETPITSDYRGYTMATQPPNSQGIALLMQANMLATCDLAAMAPDSAELVHLMVEAKKLAFVDRDAYVCDPTAHPVPVANMLSLIQAKDRVNLIDPDRAAKGYEARDFTRSGDDTIYLTVVDADGNAVALIQSLYEAFGSCVMVPETGMVLHNRGRGFTLDATHPNVLAPNKRPYHTLHPAMILKDGQPAMVLGTPGADGQTQTNIQLAVDVIDFKADAQQANEAPRWRSNPDGSLIMEDRFPDKTITALKSKGHDVQVTKGYAEIMGSSQTIMIDRENGVLKAGADPRRQAYAIGK
ncbi:MAG: gamma-glutamyltransferase [Desulfobacterales bacterium]|nr:gamma-glutamyltransferase [Desulfobacterales bacterium]